MLNNLNVGTRKALRGLARDRTRPAEGIRPKTQARLPLQWLNGLKVTLRQVRSTVGARLTRTQTRSLLAGWASAATILLRRGLGRYSAEQLAMHGLPVVLVATGILLWFLQPEQPLTELRPAETLSRQDLTDSKKAAVLPTAELISDLQMVRRAMGECDAAAAKDPGSLYFLVIPVAPTAGTAEFWTANGDQFETFILLWSDVALEGLRAGSLTLQRRPFSFSVSDSSSQGARSWEGLEGLSKITQQTSPSTANFKIGFSITGNGKDTRWSTDFPRVKGSCYWVAPLFRT